MNKETVKTVLMLLPALATFVVLLFIPLYFSLQYSMYAPNGDYLGLDAYRAAFNDTQFSTSLKFSLYVAIVSTVVAMVLAVAISMALKGTRVGKRLSLFLYQFNLPIPYISFALMISLLLMNTGLLSRMAFNLGFIGSYSEFPLMIHDPNGIGIIVTYVVKYTSFIGMSVLAILQASVKDYEDQASVLGANKIQTFIHITLPMIMPALISTSIICFAFAFGSYEAPALLGATNPKALPILSYEMYMSYDPMNRPVSYAMANIMMLIIMIAVAIYLFAISRRSART